VRPRLDVPEPARIHEKASKVLGGKSHIRGRPPGVLRHFALRRPGNDFVCQALLRRWIGNRL
jgi:hypothetical protein